MKCSDEVFSFSFAVIISFFCIITAEFSLNGITAVFLIGKI
jgi:hypothetical protein